MSDYAATGTDSLAVWVRICAVETGDDTGTAVYGLTVAAAAVV